MAFEINFLGDNIAVVHGRCDGTKDTALDTLPPNLSRTPTCSRGLWVREHMSKMMAASRRVRVVCWLQRLTLDHGSRPSSIFVS